MKRLDLFDAVLLFFGAFVFWMYVLQTPATPNEAQYKKMDDISYCWASNYGFYLPCMYSEKVVDA
jgi:hypothetical protein